MKVAIHQPHYFPWLGYFDKMAKVDAFVLLDEVQFEKGSQMIRNRVIDQTGEIKYLTISGETKGFLCNEYRDLKAKNVGCWGDRQLNALENYYRSAPYQLEIMALLQDFITQKHETIFEWTYSSIQLVRDILQIDTPLVCQSNIEYDHTCKRSDLVCAVCKSTNADVYFSGRGASVEYLDRKQFTDNGINIVFQDFSQPVYPQINTQEFVPGISVLDMLFNCGIEESRRIFWENVRSTNEFGE